MLPLVAHLTAVLRAPSTLALSVAQDIAHAAGCAIVDAHWFGNRQLTVHYDTLVGDWPRLREALRGAEGVRTTDDELAAVDQRCLGVAAEDDLLCLVSFTLIHDEGDRRRVVPSVPG